MSLVYFIVQKGLPLSRSQTWSKGHLHPYGELIVSQRISELLLAIRDADRQKFLSLWMTKMTEQTISAHDITSISSYSKANEDVKYGYNRAASHCRRSTSPCSLGRRSCLPAYYRRMPGNISDVATLKTTMKSMDFLGSSSVHFILDRGFYSKANIDEVLERRHHFTIAVPSGLTWVEEVIDMHDQSIASPQNYQPIDDSEALYVATDLRKWGADRRRVYLHIYYNARNAAVLRAPTASRANSDV